MNSNSKPHFIRLRVSEFQRLPGAHPASQSQEYEKEQSLL